MGDIALQCISACRRRWIVQRGVDAALLTTTIIAVIGSVLVVLQWLQWNQLFAFSGIAVIGSAVCTWFRRPSWEVVVRSVDTELNAHELLSSALHSHHSDEAFAGVLRAQADTFCQQRNVRDVCLQHHSAQIRIGMMLITAIALNLAWLRQTVSFPATVAAASQRTDDGTPTSTMTNVSLPNSDLPFNNRRTNDGDSDEAAASDRTFDTAGVGQRRAMRFDDAGGHAAAQTPDGVAQRLPPLVGNPSGLHSPSESFTNTLAPDHGVTAKALSNAVIWTSATAGNIAAAPPAEYRGLIQAYFSASAH